MKVERLFRVLGLTDAALVEESMEVRRRVWRRWAALAACLALAAGLGFSWRRGLGGYGSGMSGSGNAGAIKGEPSDSVYGGGTEGDGWISFLSYGGPVFPLATVEDPMGLSAEREVTWDFTPGSYPDGEPRQWGTEVTDAYVLRNSTEEDATVTALYPFAGTFDSLGKVRPQVMVDGEAVETALYAGAYSGGFEPTVGVEISDTMNLGALNSWEEYRVLLEDGRYLKQALGPYPALDVPVTVYEFSDFAAPHEKYRAATQAVSFCIDENATKILTYGFNGCVWDGGFRRYSYFVPDGVRREPDWKLLVVLGEDIGDYALQGYQDGGCDAGEEIEGVSCAVIRRETTLDAVLDQLCEYYKTYWSKARGGEADIFDTVPFAIYRGSVAELLSQYGVLSGKPMDRYMDGRLDDILSETMTQDRVLYLAFSVTVPAGGSVRVECGFWKEPSFDYGGSEPANADLQGFDLLTRLGSSLNFTRQSAALANTENVEITGQNYGFDLENGVTAVELDLEREHYYLEVRPREESKL